MNKIIEIDSKKYEINLDTAIAQGLIKPVIKKQVGQRYKHPTQPEDYLLAQIDFGVVTLIDLKDGNRYTRGVKVDNNNDITDDEWRYITTGKNFTLI